MAKWSSEVKTYNMCRECRDKSFAVSVLDSNELELLNGNCTLRNFKRGEILLEEGKPVHDVVYLREGYAAQSKKLPDGVEQVLSIVKKGNYIGLHNIIRHSRGNYVSAKALNDASACFINRECFDALLRRNGEFASRVIDVVCKNELFFIDRLMRNRYNQL
jgi:CRP-like cAMP-binding protein